MDSDEIGETRKKGVFSLLGLRFCTVILFSVISFFCLTLIVGFLVMFFGELWVSYSSSSSSAPLPSRCKIVSSTVDLRSSKVCGLGLLNIKAKHVFYPFEKDKFRCRYDYYWASVFKVEYKDHLLGHTRLAYAEAPNEALPLECRPNFGVAFMTKDNFKAGFFTSLTLGNHHFSILSVLLIATDSFCLQVNETYDCWYTLGRPKIKLYPDTFFACRAANDPSITEIIKQYAFLLTKFFRALYSGEDKPKYWRYDVVAGIVSGFSTSIVTIFFVRIIQRAKSWFPRGCHSVGRLFQVNLLLQLKRACFIVAYFSIVGWMAIQYLKMLKFRKA